MARIYGQTYGLGVGRSGPLRRENNITLAAHRAGAPYLYPQNPMLTPPSTGSTAPVTNLAAGEAR